MVMENVLGILTEPVDRVFLVIPANALDPPIYVSRAVGAALSCN